MPYIIPNNLLTPTEKVIKPYNCSMIAVDGPQIKGRLNLEGMEIPYDTQYTSQLVLNESDADKPIYYGFLGNNVTFLMIKATYEPSDPNWEIEADQYIAYYFSDNPTKIRYMGKLMILTGNSAKKIPQIYLTNPNSAQKVYLEVFMANQGENDPPSLVETFSGLYYNNVISDCILSASTSLYITDIDDNTQLVIPYTNINIIEKSTGSTLVIGNDTDDKIYLEFLSNFNMNQAHSRMSWVMEDISSRCLTKSSPTIDTVSPVISWTTSGSTETGFTFIPWSGVTLTKTDIADYFITGVTDTRDGDISIYDVDITIYELNNLIPLDSITEEGQYTLYFKISDIADNENIQSRQVIVDISDPVINFKDIASGSTFDLSISSGTTSSTYITPTDVRTYTVDSVTDNVSTGLTISDISVILSGDTCYPCTGSTISLTGDTYNVLYSLSDWTGNESTYTKTMYTIT